MRNNSLQKYQTLLFLPRASLVKIQYVGISDILSKMVKLIIQNKMHCAIRGETIVSAYLDLAENRANRRIVMNMNDWSLFLDKFLELSDYPILLDKGKVLALKAKQYSDGNLPAS